MQKFKKFKYSLRHLQLAYIFIIKKYMHKSIFLIDLLKKFGCHLIS